MGFLKFLFRHLFATAVAIIGAAFAVTGLATDAQSLFELGLSSRVWAATGAALFMVAVIWMQYQLEERLTGTINAVKGQNSDLILTPLQEKLLSLTVGYLKKFGVKKLIVIKKTSSLYFDDDKERGAGIDLAHDMYGAVGEANRNDLIELYESMPPEYLRLIPNTRWDGPLEVMVPEAGHRYLRTYRL